MGNDNQTKNHNSFKINKLSSMINME